MREIASAFAAFATFALLGGCVASEHQLVNRAREAYDDCLSQHTRKSSECEPERRGYNVAVERYEESSRRVWGCGPGHAQADCPR